jgi:hypothetical protein
MQRLLTVWLVCSLTAVLSGDVLVLRDGSRVHGELLSVRGDVIEFEEQRGSGRGRTIRVDRAEVARIEFESSWATNRTDRGFAGGGRPSGLRERQVIVTADAGWSDSGITVRAGDTIYVEASGTVRWGRDRRDGPGGENNSPVNPNRPIPNRPAAALIGRIGDSAADAFFIGDERGPIRMRASGRLYLGINDDFLPDNSGNFRVVVFY